MKRSLTNGIVPSYHITDAQGSYKTPQLKSTFKLGGAIFSTTVTSSMPQALPIGGFYYVCSAVDGLLSK